MKKLIGILLACILAISVTACTNAENTEQNSSTTQTPTQSQTVSQTQEQTQAPETETKNMSVNVPVLETQDWQEYTFSQYNGREEYTISLEIPEKCTYDSTIIYNEENIKYGEVSGIVPYIENKPAFDGVELNKAYGEITYTDKKSGVLENGKKYSLLIGSAPVEIGMWNICDYLVDFNDYYVNITMYSVNSYDEMAQEYENILNSITVK